MGCCGHIRLGGPCLRCGNPRHSPRTCDEERDYGRLRWERLFAELIAAHEKKSQLTE